MHIHIFHALVVITKYGPFNDDVTSQEKTDKILKKKSKPLCPNLCQIRRNVRSVSWNMQGLCNKTMLHLFIYIIA